MKRETFPTVQYPFVLVLWDDSTGFGAKWVSKREVDERKLTLCLASGYLIEDVKERITLAPHIAFDDDMDFDEVSGTMMIPRSVIHRMVTLVKAGYEPRARK